MSYQGTGRRGPDPKCIMDDTWVEQYLALIHDGASPVLAAECLGLSRFTLYKYLARGGHPNAAANAEWVDPDEALVPYASFVARSMQAEARATVDVVKSAHRKAVEDGDAALTYLKQRHPAEWSQTRIKPVAPAVEVKADEDNGARVVVYMPDNGRSAPAGDGAQLAYDPTARPVIPRPEPRSPWPTTRRVEPALPVQPEGGPEPKPLTPYDDNPPKARAWLEDKYPGLGIAQSDPDTIFYTRGDYRYSERNPRVFAFMAQFYDWGQVQ